MSEDRPFSGADLKAAREAIGWPRTVLAAKLGCDEGTIRNLEAANSLPIVLRLWIEPIVAVVGLPPPPRDSWLSPGGRKRS